MANDMNICHFIGRLGADPEIRYSPSGTAFANFDIACGRTTKDQQGNKQELTEWVPIVAAGKMAEIIGQYLRKGSKVQISGRFQTRSWDDQEGKKRYKTEIFASEMQMLDSRPEGQQQAPQQHQPAPQQRPVQQPAPQPAGWDEFMDDIPFSQFERNTVA